MPVYKDDISNFGTPTSDTMRTAVSNKTTKILVMIICFDNHDLMEDENLLINLYKNYANARNIEKLSIM